MAQISIDGDVALSVDLGEMPERNNKALVRSMNRAIGSGRTVMVRLVSKDTGLKSSTVRDAMPIQNATFTKPVARFGASLKRIPLFDFKARQTKRGVTYSNPGSGGRTLIPSAFLGTMKSGHEGAFKRKGKKRLPIVELFGPSLGKVFAKFRPQGVARVEEAFEQNFGHELDFAQNGGVGGGGDGAD